MRQTHHSPHSIPNHLPNHYCRISFLPPRKYSSQMAEPSKKRKGVATSSAITGTRSHGTSKVQTSQIPSSISSPTLFSLEEHRIWYNSLFSSHSIIDPKFVDLAFFDDEVFERVYWLGSFSLLIVFPPSYLGIFSC